jgi:hypothetical protein
MVNWKGFDKKGSSLIQVLCWQLSEFTEETHIHTASVIMVHADHMNIINQNI